MAGFDDRDHGGRTSRLQRHRRTAQVHLEGDAGGEVVLVVSEFALERADLDLGDEIREKLAVGAEIRQEVGIEVSSRIDADPLLVGLGRVAAALHRLPGQLEEDALLRVHDLRVLGQDPEEVCVEFVDVINEPLRWNVAGFSELLGIFDLILTEGGNRFDPIDEIPPESVGIVRPGHAESHADDGDSVVGGAARMLRRGRRNRGGRALCVELRGLGRDGGQFEKFDQLQGRAELAAERGMQAHELDRAAAEGREGIVESDLFDGEDAAPDFGETCLRFRARLHEGLGDLGTRTFCRSEKGLKHLRITQLGGDALGKGGVEKAGGTGILPVIDRQDAGPT